MYKETTTKNGNRVGYRVEGAGNEALLWLAGTGCSSGTWHQQFSHFSGTYTCVAPDLPGIGVSDVPDTGTCTPSSLANDTLAVLDDMGIESAHMVGFSLGAAIAQEIALQASHRAKSIVLIGTWGSTAKSRHLAQHFQSRCLALQRADRDVFRKFGFWIWSSTIRDNEEQRAKRLSDSFEGQASSVTDGGYVAHYDADLAHMAGSRLEHITCPAMVICGSEDMITLPRYNREVASAIPNCELHEVPYGGHMVWYEQPEIVDDLIRQFVVRNS